MFLFGAETLATGANRSGIVVVNDLNEIRGLDVKTGERRWRIRFTHTPTVTLDADVVLVTTTRGKFETGTTGVVTAYDRRTGERTGFGRRGREARASATDDDDVRLGHAQSPTGPGVAAASTSP